MVASVEVFMVRDGRTGVIVGCAPPELLGPRKPLVMTRPVASPDPVPGPISTRRFAVGHRPNRTREREPRRESGGVRPAERCRIVGEYRSDSPPPQDAAGHCPARRTRRTLSFPRRHYRDFCRFEAAAELPNCVDGLISRVFPYTVGGVVRGTTDQAMRWFRAGLHSGLVQRVVGAGLVIPLSIAWIAFKAVRFVPFVDQLQDLFIADPHADFDEDEAHEDERI